MGKSSTDRVVSAAYIVYVWRKKDATMGLFDHFRKKKEKSAAILPGFVLLSDNSLDIDLLIKYLYSDWGIAIPLADINIDDGRTSFVSSIDNMLAAISLMPAPVPNEEAVENAKTNFRWTEAVSVTESHKAHIMVIVMPQENQSVIEVGTLQTKLCYCCLKLPNAIAINTAGTVFPPEYYINTAMLAIEERKFPIFNHVFFGIYSNDNGKTVSGYTYGLENLGKQDIEVIDSTNSATDVFGFLADISSYVMDSDATLTHGETIGFSAEQKLSITESKGVAIDGKTLKIGF